MLLERKVARAERERDLAERDCAEIEALPTLSIRFLALSLT